MPDTIYFSPEDCFSPFGVVEMHHDNTLDAWFFFLGGVSCDGQPMELKVFFLQCVRNGFTEGGETADALVLTVNSVEIFRIRASTFCPGFFVTGRSPIYGQSPCCDDGEEAGWTLYA